MKAEAAARNSAKKKAEDELKEKMANSQTGPHLADQATALASKTLVKGSDPSRECQSRPVPPGQEGGEGVGQFDFLNKDFDVPQRAAVEEDCTGVSVEELMTNYNWEQKRGSGEGDEEPNIREDHEFVRRMSSIQEANEPASMRRSPRRPTKRLTKLDLDRLLDADVNVLEAGSFFDLYELGDVVSAVNSWKYITL